LTTTLSLWQFQILAFFLPANQPKPRTAPTPFKHAFVCFVKVDYRALFQLILVALKLAK
jgi:hypothetical protein